MGDLKIAGGFLFLWKSPLYYNKLHVRKFYPTSYLLYGQYSYTFGSMNRSHNPVLTRVSVLSLSFRVFLLACLTVPRPFLFSFQLSTEGMNLFELLGINPAEYLSSAAFVLLKLTCLGLTKGSKCKESSFEGIMSFQKGSIFS